jgi:hypothetical protein
VVLQASVRGDESMLPAFAEGVQPGATGVVLRFEAGRTVTGTVLEPSGEPASQGNVAAEPLPTASPRRPWRHGTVRAGGRFEIRGLDGGTYRVRMTHLLIQGPGPGVWHAHAPSDAVVLTPPARDVTLRQHPATTLRGRVVEGGANATAAWSSAQVQTSAAVGRDGSFELKGLVDEPGTLHVSTGGDRYGLLRDVRPSAGQVEIALENGTRIAGRVEIPKELDPVWVQLTLHGDGVVLRAHVKPDRTFEARGVPPGAYEARLHVDGEDTTHPTPVEAGAKDVVIRWEPPR